MIVTTTQSITDRDIDVYLGIVSGEAILGANIFRDLFARKEIALAEMTEQAVGLGATAIVGVDLDYETLGANGGMLMVSASGTAVHLR